MPRNEKPPTPTYDGVQDIHHVKHQPKSDQGKDQDPPVQEANEMQSDISLSDSVPENGDADSQSKESSLTAQQYRQKLAEIFSYRKGQESLQKCIERGLDANRKRIEKKLSKHPKVNVMTVGEIGSGKTHFVNTTCHAFSPNSKWHERGMTGNGVNMETRQPNVYDTPHPSVYLIDGVGGEPEKAQKLISYSPDSRFRDYIRREQKLTGMLPEGCCDLFLLFVKVSKKFCNDSTETDEKMQLSTTMQDTRKWIDALKNARPFIIVLTGIEQLTKEELRKFRKAFSSHMQLSEGYLHELRTYQNSRENIRDPDLDLQNLLLWERIFKTVEERILEEDFTYTTLFQYLQVGNYLSRAVLLLSILFAALIFVGYKNKVPVSVCLFEILILGIARSWQVSFAETENKMLRFFGV